METINKTEEHGITDRTERGLFITWSVVVMVTSLVGDTIILAGTLKYRAIKKHKVIVAVIQHMAVCDLLLTMFRVIPVTVAFVADRWIVGMFLCHVQDKIGWVCAAVTTFLTCLLAAVKLMVVRCPLKTITWTTRLGHKICGVVWLMVLVLYTPVLVVKMKYLRDTIHFSYIDYECNYGYKTNNTPAWYTWYFIVGFPAINVTCHVTLIITSLLLLMYARRAAVGNKLRWEGVITVLLTVGVLLVSYLPLTVLLVTWLVGFSYSDTLWRVAACVQYLNIMANFFVYSISLKSFRDFLKTKYSEIFCKGRWYSNKTTRPLPLQTLRIPDFKDIAGSTATLAIELEDLLPSNSRNETLEVMDKSC